MSLLGPESQLGKTSALYGQGRTISHGHTPGRQHPEGIRVPQSFTTPSTPHWHQLSSRHISDADKKLWPGQFVRATLQLTTRPNAVVVRTKLSKPVRMGSSSMLSRMTKPSR